MITETEAKETRPETAKETEAPTEPATAEAPEPQPVTYPVELYQLVPETLSLMMSYVIVTPNHKIVVIDGGIDGNGVEAEPYLPSAIRAILGLGENDPFEIEAWFLSHAHRDHYYELAKMLNAYTPESNYRINNFYFDFPDYGVEWESRYATDFDNERFQKLVHGVYNYYSQTESPDGTGPEDERYYYDRINGAVINAGSVKNGLCIDVDGVKFNILMTWRKEATSVNNTSVIIRMEYKDNSVLFLGDCGAEEGKWLLEEYDAEELRSDYVQMGHHGQGGPDKDFYDAIKVSGSKRLWPTPSWVWNDAKTYRTGETRSWVGLPFEAADYRSQGFGDAGNDFVAGLYEKTAGARANKVSRWKQAVLDDQRIAVFE